MYPQLKIFLFGDPESDDEQDLQYVVAEEMESAIRLFRDIDGREFTHVRYIADCLAVEGIKDPNETDNV